MLRKLIHIDAEKSFCTFRHMSANALLSSICGMRDQTSYKRQKKHRPTAAETEDAEGDPQRPKGTTRTYKMPKIKEEE